MNVPTSFSTHGGYVKLKKISHLICLAQFKLGEFIFPMFESMLRFIENKDPEVRRHFIQALSSLKKKKRRMTLSLRALVLLFLLIR